MTKKASKTATIAKSITKTTKALLSGNKGLKKLTAALPLTAILVEEVRAAQINPKPLDVPVPDSAEQLAMAQDAGQVDVEPAQQATEVSSGE